MLQSLERMSTPVSTSKGRLSRSRNDEVTKVIISKLWQPPGLFVLISFLLILNSNKHPIIYRRTSRLRPISQFWTKITFETHQRNSTRRTYFFVIHVSWYAACEYVWGRRLSHIFILRMKWNLCLSRMFYSMNPLSWFPLYLIYIISSLFLFLFSFLFEFEMPSRETHVSRVQMSNL